MVAVNMGWGPSLQSDNNYVKIGEDSSFLNNLGAGLNAAFPAAGAAGAGCWC
jgi:hypothetical protein